MSITCEFSSAIVALRRWLAAIGVFSGVVNVLALTGSIFMLQVYDRVLTSRSIPTLVALAAIAIAFYFIQGILDIARARLLVRLGSRLDQLLADRIYAASLELPLRFNGIDAQAQPVRDLDTVRAFLSGQGPVALMDIPWMPIYLAFVFILHPWLGWLASAGALVLIVMAASTEFLSRRPAAKAQTFALKRHALAESGRRNAEVLRAMGFAHRIASQWQSVNATHLSAHQNASDVSSSLGAAAKVFRMILQSAMLALGAWLTILGEVSGGAIIASSIISSRALAPVDTAIAQWKSFVAARGAKHRLAKLLSCVPAVVPPMPLPAPCKSLALEAVSVTPPGSTAAAAQNVSFALKAGDAMGLVGHSAAGKSTLVRGIVGAWHVARGKIRLDGASIDNWCPMELGRHIGYLPQDVSLFEGSIAENIARFEESADPNSIVAAAKDAAVHEMILKLPQGYDTRVGEGGSMLSAGQRQRIGLARALFGSPFLVVLDEPNSNLDADGEAALTAAIESVRLRRGIVIVVAHRPSALANVNLVGVMAGGTLQAFGPKAEILRKTVAPGKGGSGPALQAMSSKPCHAGTNA
ncbi:Type I secretion system ATP-binding protein PrsD [Hyphomicrobium sp. 1Nfss2.1]|uniref:type I secretion system permease/ATPase n=1 Tax=Hyphomicrobium sp. 1Nfss2.1 TaxID=3413936 RepID=UPI003C7A0859